jgi:TonB-dependent starch-binding outer membrane protein SusC
MGKKSGYFSNIIVTIISVLVCLFINNASYAKFSETFLNDSTIIVNTPAESQADSLCQQIHSGIFSSSSVITSLAPESFANTTQPGIQSALQGKATGVYIQGGSGNSGQLINVRIRGTSSIAGNNQPLYVIDGMPFTDLFPNYTQNESFSILNFLNPDDIEKIEIIRDASSAAYFGSMASNGAIVITTKKGRPGKTQFSFNTQLGVSGPATNSPDRNAENPGDTSIPNAQNRNEQGFTQQYNFAASGGSEKFLFYSSLSYYNQESFILHHDFERISGRINFDYKPIKKLSLSLKLNPSINSPERIYLNNSRYSPLASELNPPHFSFGTNDMNTLKDGENPLPLPNSYESSFRFYNGTGNLTVRYDLTDNLHLTTELNNNLNLFKYSYSTNYQQENHVRKEVVSDQSSYLYRNENYFLTYQHGFKEDFKFSVVTGISNYNLKNYSFFSQSERKNISYYVISSLNYKEKLFFETSGRVERSSVFPEKNRQIFSPFASASWIVINKQQANQIFLPDFLKVKVSYGLTGNDQYYTRTAYALTNFDLDWQKVSHINGGIDFGFFKNRLLGELNLYKRKTTNAFIGLALPFSQATNTINGGEISNQGIELELNHTNNVGKLFWSSSFNLSYNKNTVTNLGGTTISAGNWRVMENEPIGTFWMPVYAGIDPETGDVLYYTDDTRTETTNLISQAKPQKAGDPNPNFIGGFTNNFRYQNFDLGFTFQFVYGNEIFNWQTDGSNWIDNQTVDFYENYWKAPGDSARYPQPRFLEGNGQGVSSMQLFDGSYIRLKDATIGYTIHSGTLANYGVNSLRVFVTGHNLLTFTKYPGWDPEAAYFGIGTANTIQQGFDFYNAPQPRTITFGLSMGF